MLALSHQSPPSPHKRTVSFAPEVDAKAEERAIREDKKKVNRLLLQSDVAFVIDKQHALSFLVEAKAIIDRRSFVDQETHLKLSSRDKVFKLYGYSI